MTETERWLLVLDEGTTSTRAILYAPDGRVGGVAQRPITQHYPGPGWDEHDAHEILDATLACAHELVAKAGGADRIAAIGITNQRETVVAWDRASGRALHRAIVWQDRRTAENCDALRAAGHDVELLPDAFSDTMGHAGALVRHPDGRIEGAADPRSDGAACGV